MRMLCKIEYFYESQRFTHFMQSLKRKNKQSRQYILSAQVFLGDGAVHPFRLSGKRLRKRIEILRHVKIVNSSFHRCSTISINLQVHISEKHQHPSHLPTLSSLFFSLCFISHVFQSRDGMSYRRVRYPSTPRSLELPFHHTLSFIYSWYILCLVFCQAQLLISS